MGGAAAAERRLGRGQGRRGWGLAHDCQAFSRAPGEALPGVLLRDVLGEKATEPGKRVTRNTALGENARRLDAPPQAEPVIAGSRGARKWAWPGASDWRRDCGPNGSGRGGACLLGHCPVRRCQRSRDGLQSWRRVHPVALSPGSPDARLCCRADPVPGPRS